MPNTYGRLSELKAELGITTTTSDAVLLRVLERSARAIDEHCNRHFYSLLAQTLLYPTSERPAHIKQYQLWLDQDVISITTLKTDDDGDGTYETTLTANTDYWTYPYNNQTHEPIQRLDVNPDSAMLRYWPSAPRSVQLIGKRGFSEETAAAGTIAEELDSSETGVDLTAGHDVGVGDTIIVDSEHIDVTAMASTNTATVTRGVNGSTAAAHTTSTAVARRRFPREIELACVLQAARFFREIQTGYGGSVGNNELAGFSFRAMYPAYRDAIDPYRIRVIA